MGTKIVYNTEIDITVVAVFGCSVVFVVMAVFRWYSDVAPSWYQSGRMLAVSVQQTDSTDIAHGFSFPYADALVVWDVRCGVGGNVPLRS